MPAKLSSWILTIAARRAIDELRRMRPTLGADVELTGERSADDRMMRRELQTAIEAALRELTPELRAGKSRDCTDPVATGCSSTATTICSAAIRNSSGSTLGSRYQ